MNSRWIWAALIALCFCGLAVAQDAPDRARLSADAVFFTQPYGTLQPPVRDLVGLDLGLDYIAIRYQYGFANVANAKEQPLGFRQRMAVKEADQLKKIEKQAGLKVGDPITLIGENGAGVPGKVVGFSFVGASPSTIIVAADVRPAKTVPRLATSPGLALRGAYNLAPVPGLVAEDIKKSDPNRARLVALCADPLGSAFAALDEEVTAAPLAAGGAPLYFVSFWKRPTAPDFEIDEVELYSCLFRVEGSGYARANLPLKFRLLGVSDLDRDGKAELFAEAGDGTEVCHLFLTPKGDGFATLKKGLCSGY